MKNAFLRIWSKWSARFRRAVDWWRRQLSFESPAGVYQYHSWTDLLGLILRVLLLLLPLLFLLSVWVAFLAPWLTPTTLSAHLPAVFLTLALLVCGLWGLTSIPFWLRAAVVVGGSWLAIRGLGPVPQAQRELLAGTEYTHQQVQMILASPAFMDSQLARLFARHVPLEAVKAVEALPPLGYLVGVLVSGFVLTLLYRWGQWAGYVDLSSERLPDSNRFLLWFVALSWPALIIQPVALGVLALTWIDMLSATQTGIGLLVLVVLAWPGTWKGLGQFKARALTCLRNIFGGSLSTSDQALVPFLDVFTGLWMRFRRRMAVWGHLINEIPGWFTGWLDRPALWLIAHRDKPLAPHHQKKLEEWGQSRLNGPALWRLIGWQRKQGIDHIEGFLRQEASGWLLETLCWGAPDEEFMFWFKRLVADNPETALRVLEELGATGDSRAGKEAYAHLLGKAGPSLRKRITRQLGRSPGRLELMS